MLHHQLISPPPLGSLLDNTTEYDNRKVKEEEANAMNDLMLISMGTLRMLEPPYVVCFAICASTKLSYLWAFDRIRIHINFEALPLLAFFTRTMGWQHLTVNGLALPTEINGESSRTSLN